MSTNHPEDLNDGDTAELPVHPPSSRAPGGQAPPSGSTPASGLGAASSGSAFAGTSPVSSGRPGSGPAGSRGSGRLRGDGRDSIAPEAPGLRFIRELGRGGLGSVWLAMQETEEFRRQVAVKIVRRGLDTEDILTRFNLERQLLAGLEHPNIVRLYGAGTVADGRPYFVMENVDGISIDRFCDERRLSIEKRLELFLQVCRAVQHAHSRLIVHRDLKPSNILVTADGTVKLLDFGIAKLVDSSLSPVSLDPTAPELRVLTPEYASPEQVRGQPIGTPSDVYSLGVILYELLTGQRPYRIRTRVMRELERIVCEEEPAQPSTVVAKRGESLQVEPSVDGDTRVVRREVDPNTISKARGVPVERLSRRLRGDLDVIVLHALGKQPNGRYASAEALASDLSRHLRNEPIEARPLRGIQRAAKFVRRNRVQVALGGLVGLALVGGLSGLYFAEVARGANDRAAATALLQEAEERLAEMRLAQVREMSEVFLTKFYERLRPMQGGAELRGMLADTVSRQIELLEKQDDIAGERVADAQFDRLLALSYRGLGRVRGDMRGESNGDYAGARQAFERSSEILTRLQKDLPEEQVPGIGLDIARTNLFWADAARVAGEQEAARQKLADTDSLLAARGASANKDERVLHAVVLGELSEMADKRGGAAEASDFMLRSLAIRRSLAAAEPKDLDLARHLAKGLQAEQWRAEQAGDARRSLELADELVEIRGRLAAARPDDARVARELMLSQLARCRALLRSGRANDTVQALEAACVEATGRVERAPDSHEALSDRALAYETSAQILEEIAEGDAGRLSEALERVRLARADLVRAAGLAPAQTQYPRRAAYLGAREAKTLLAIGNPRDASMVARASAAYFENALRSAAPDADTQQQAAITMAVASNACRQAGEAVDAARLAERARAVLLAMPDARRAAVAPFVDAELGTK